MRYFIERAANKAVNLVANVYEETLYKFQKAIGKVGVADIVTPERAGEKVVVFKPDTIETFQYPKVYHFIKEALFTVEYPEIALWKYKDAVVTSDSDIVISKNGDAIWQKYFYFNYAKNIVGDSNFVREEKGRISYKRNKIKYEVETAFSLIGVFAHVWAHVLVEYYPKLAVLKDAIADSEKKITVLLPEIKDVQTHQIIYDELKKYDVDILIVHKGESVKASTLYYMERPTRFTDHEDCLAPGDMAVPSIVGEYLKSNLVIPHTEGMVKDPKFSKLFLVRRGGIGKGLLNVDEIESFFEKKGFYFVEPHKMSLEEKIRMFYSADIVVGPLGSAFTNLIFCKPGTKVMQLSNYQRLFENYISMQIRQFDMDVLYVTGIDDKNASNMTHCSFYMPMDKVVEAATFHSII